ncbi:MAG: tRNA uridine-5-carboxymethylaminomethyl(34) synthesis GTPase MnmE [Bacteroidales bacterium]|nr:tRNA uridine-5-carboxymethylaminomethyl(34) synthesis GTPase MnmE [Bacteroidales bacterium]MDT8432893.1 tRNA uridine-5-carboxymethylaminomethyl(34) synthesis GTPase MnmE [Bacteroidales bacterium]
MSETTICAVATSGQGALAIIRVSGPDTFEIVQSVFRPSTAGKAFSALPPNTIHYGTIVEGDEIVDEVLVSLFRAPQSYTGEDVIEISCHGSTYIQQRIMQLLTEHGAVPARPGEFTQRAFLHGKMDLSQAEAVADLIASESRASHDVAMQQIRGGFSKKIKELRDRLLHFISLIELELDFSEEDVEFADRGELTRLVAEVKELVDSLKDSFQLGNVLKTGVPVAIVGRPNVGKSTLLNVLLNEERAIVSEIEGTTRDTVEDTVIINGILYRFIDTAGIRETADTIESLGIRRTYQKIDQASVVMLLVEASDGSELIIESLQAIRQQLEGKGKQLILVINKSDIGDPQVFDDAQLQENEYACRISAKHHQNIDQLRETLINAVSTGSIRHQDVVITNIRHYNALNAASDSLERVLDGLSATLPQDLLAQDIRETLHYLGEITGEVTTDEILGNIFKNFCIGK